MAASNPACFQKLCKCATCRWVCSRCGGSIPFTPSGECQGATDCRDWRPLSWEAYQQGLGWTGPANDVTKENFIKAVNGITDSVFDQLCAAGVIKRHNGTIEFDQMVLYAHLRKKGMLSEGVKVSSLKERYAELKKEGKLCD